MVNTQLKRGQHTRHCRDKLSTRSHPTTTRYLRQVELGALPILGELLGPQVMLATVNQVKGLTFDFTCILVP